MYGCESWTIKKTEHWRIDAFQLWCWRRLLRVPWTTRRSNQSILKEISSEYSLEGLMLKLKLQYFGHLMQKAASLEKTLILGKTEGRRRRDDRGWDGWMASLKWAPGVGNGQGSLACCSPWGCKESDTTEWLKWTELNQSILTFYYCWRLLSVKGSISVSLNLHFVYLLCNNICFIHFLCLEFFLIIHLLLKLSLCYLEMWYL